MSDESMTLESFRAQRESGINPYEGMEEADAAPQEQEHVEPDMEQEDYQDNEQSDTSAGNDDVEEHIEVPENQRTAFQKALEREKRKAKESAEQQYKTEYETQLNPYKQFFDSLGMDPQTAMKAIEENKIKQEAENLAYQNGWSDEQTQMFVRQQQLERQQTEMQVNLRVYELADTPEYPGIKNMKGAITEFVRNNPRVPVEQAYWAVGGPNLAKQMKLEAEQREIVKRGQTKRTVLSDSPTDMRGPAPMPPEAVAFMKRTGLSEAQFRAQYMSDAPLNQTEYRKMRDKKG